MKRLVIALAAILIIPWQITSGGHIARADSPPSVYTSPDPVPAGSTLTVGGSFFITGGLGSTVTVCIQVPSPASPTCQFNVPVNSIGSFSTTFFIPASTPAGLYQAYAYNAANPTVYQPFHVAPPTGAANIYANQSVYSPGQTIHINGSNWPSNTQVTICVTPNTFGASPNCVTTATFTNGTIVDAQILIPTTVTGGFYTLQACVLNQACPNPATYPIQIQSSASFSVSPTNIQPGGTITVSGSGLQLGSATATLFNNSGTTIVSNTASVNSNGTVTIPLTLPTSIQPGTYSVQLSNTNTSNNSATIGTQTITVSTQPQIVLTPNAVPPGGQVKVSGSNFTPGAPLVVSVSITTTGGQQQNIAPVVTVASDGTFTATLPLPSNTAVGSYAVVVYPSGNTGNILASQPLVVQVASIRLSTGTQPAGSPVTVTGSGFLPGEPVTITLNANGNVYGTFNATADSSGNLTYTFTVPISVVPGSYTVTAIGQTSRQSVQAALNVTTAAAIIVSPLNANPNATVSVTGQNFLPNSQVTVTAQVPLSGNAGLRTVTSNIQTNASGGFTTAIQVPSNAAPGAVTVTANQQQGATTISQSTTLTIQPLTPSINFPQSTVNAGTTLPVNLNGFAPGPNATVNLTCTQNGVQICSFSVDVNNAGGAVTSLAIPSSAASGQMTVSAVQPSSGASITQSIFINAVPTATPIPTNTPTPTLTPPNPPPVPKPGKKMKFSSASLSVATVAEGKVNHIDIQANQGGRISVTIVITYPNGKIITYRGFTDSKGHFALSFKVPKNIIRGKNHKVTVRIRLQKGKRGVSRTLTFKVKH